MGLDPIGQYRPAPEFAEEAIAAAPVHAQEEPGYLEEMALRLDQMKLDAKVDAERLRPGLNGFFALVLITGVAYFGLFVAQYQAGTMAALENRTDYLNVPRGTGALAIGLAAAVAAAVWSIILKRRSHDAIQAYERELVARGGTPLPERGQPLRLSRG